MEGVIFAGGRNDVFAELTSTRMKALLPVGNRPLIWYPLRMFEQCGMYSVLIICSDLEMERDLKIHLNALLPDFMKKMTISYVSIMNTLPSAGLLPGTIDCLRTARSRIKSSSVVISSCDLVSDIDLLEVFDVNSRGFDAITSVYAPMPDPGQGRKNPVAKETEIAVVAQTVVTPDTVSGKKKAPYRLLKVMPGGKGVRIPPELQEKFPKIKIIGNLREAHVYMTEAWVLDYILSRSSQHSLRKEGMKDLINEGQHREPVVPKTAAKGAFLDFVPQSEWTKLLKTGVGDAFEETNVGIFVQERLCIRANTLAAYLEANRQLLTNHPEFLKEQKPLRGEGAVVNKGATVDAACTIGKGTTVADKVTLKACVIGAKCEISEKCKVMNCVLMDNVVIKEGCNIQNSVIGQGTQIEERSQLKDCFVSADQTLPSGSQRTSDNIGFLRNV